MKKAAVTRLTILQKAFELIYAKGYRTTSIDHIIATTQVTKGAFYYHFKNKDEMGVAIIKEILKPNFAETFKELLHGEEDPVITIYNLMHKLLMENDFLQVEYGCPVSNLTQDMTPWNDKFNKALNEMTGEWKKEMISHIEKGKKNGFLRQEIGAEQVAVFVLSGYWGVRGLGKLKNSKKVYVSYLQHLKYYLNTLR